MELVGTVDSTTKRGEIAFALKRDGTLVGLTVFSLAPPPLLNNVVAVSAREFCSLAIVNDGSPYIEQHPWSQTVYSGSSASFNLVSVGIEPLSYQWKFNGANLPGATNAKLSLTNVPLSSAGSYQCVVTNLYGAATSSAAILTVVRSTPQISGVAYSAANGLTLHVSGLSGHGSVIVYPSTNLSTWLQVYTNPPIAGTLDYLDGRAAAFPVRFYRIGEQ